MLLKINCITLKYPLNKLPQTRKSLQYLRSLFEEHQKLFKMANRGGLSSAKSLVQLGNTFTQSGGGCLKKCLQLSLLHPLPSHKFHTFPKIPCRASAFYFATTVFAMQFFNALASNAKNMKRLLTLNNPRAAFTNASTAVANASTFCDLTDIKCSSDHTNFKFIVRTVFIASQRTS